MTDDVHYLEEGFTPSVWVHAPAPWWYETCCTVYSYIILFRCHYRNCFHQHLTVSPGYGSVHLLLPLHTIASEPLLTLHYHTDILHLPSPSMHCTRATGPAPVILGVKALRRRSHIPHGCWGLDVLSPLLASKHSELR